MSDTPQVREPELHDDFADKEDPVIPVDPDHYIPLLDDYSACNYGDETIGISLRIIGGKKLIGFHKI